MRYIRFLKPPRVQNDSVSALITVTSDLGDAFLQDDVELQAFVSPGLKRQVVNWRRGMRVLPVTIPISHETSQSVQLVISSLGVTAVGDDLRGELPRIVSAISAPFVPKNGSVGDRLVERRLKMSDNTVLSIWEQSDESIARHVWFENL